MRGPGTASCGWLTVEFGVEGMALLRYDEGCGVRNWLQEDSYSFKRGSFLKLHLRWEG